MNERALRVHVVVPQVATRGRTCASGRTFASQRTLASERTWPSDRTLKACRTFVPGRTFATTCTSFEQPPPSSCRSGKDSPALGLVAPGISEAPAEKLPPAPGNSSELDPRPARLGGPAPAPTRTGRAGARVDHDSTFRGANWDLLHNNRTAGRGCPEMASGTDRSSTS